MGGCCVKLRLNWYPAELSSSRQRVNPPHHPHSVNDFKVPVLSGLGLDEVDKWWASHHKGVLMQLGGFAADVLVGGQGAY